MTIPIYTVERIANYCRAKGYKLNTNEGEINIIWVEGMNPDGKINGDEPNQFNDTASIYDHQFTLLGCWSGTTEPGRWYTQHPMNPKGAARIAFGQYKSWRVGIHGNSEPHEALVQVAPVAVYRDRNRDMLRTGDELEWGLFGINQHWGYDLPPSDIGLASAGCMVIRSRQGHREFMSLVKTDIRYDPVLPQNKRHIFSTIIIPGDQL